MPYFLPSPKFYDLRSQIHFAVFRVFFLHFLFTCIALTASAQIPPFHNDELRKSKGSLPDDFVNDLVIDESNVLWAATQHGLLRLTNSDTTILTSENSSLPYDAFKCVIAGSGRSVFLGTYKGEVLHLSQTLQVKRFALPCNTQEHTAHTTSMLQVNNNLLWVGTEEHGLFAIDLESGEITSLFKEASFSRIFGLAHAGKGEVWLLTDAGLFRSLPPYRKLKAHKKYSGIVNSVHFSDDTHWVSLTKQGKPALFREKKSLPSQKGVHYQARKIVQGKQGELWMASMSGLAYYDGKTWHSLTPESGEFPTTAISSLALTDSSLWVGTYGHGLLHLRKPHEADYTLPFGKGKIKLGSPLALKALFIRGMAVLHQDSDLSDILELMRHYPTAKILLEGHTDNQGDEKSNMRLSLNRAKTVKRFLVENGIDETRIQVKAYAGRRPVAPNDTEENRRKNRRVEVRVVSF